MKSATLAVICLLAIVPLGYGLKCFVCTNTDDMCTKEKLKDDKSKQMDCPSDMKKCMRVWGKPKDSDTAGVVASCASDLICSAAEKVADDDCKGECAVGCCTSDLCNSGTSASLSVLLMTVCSALSLLLIK